MTKVQMAIIVKINFIYIRHLHIFIIHPTGKNLSKTVGVVDYIPFSQKKLHFDT